MTTTTNMELQNWPNTTTSATRPTPPPPPVPPPPPEADDLPPPYQRFADWALPTPSPDVNPPQRYSNLHMIMRFVLGIYETFLIFRFSTGASGWIAGERSRRDGYLNQDVAVLFGVSFQSSSSSY